MMRRIVATAAVTLALVSAVSPAGATSLPSASPDVLSASTPKPPARAAWMVRPCAQEDSVDCAWNAAELGNGVGHSFYAVRRALLNASGHRVGRVICLFYVKPADARRWDGCHVLPKGENGSL